MTRTKWAKLSPEEQRITMAKLCGWKSMGYAHGDREALVGYPPDITGDYWTPVPDYLNDLNAMHLACKRQWETQGTSWQVAFNRNLYAVLGHHDHIEDEAIHATAAQRAEALVLTLEESK